MFGQFRYDLNENASWYFKALLNSRKSTNQAAPEPIQLGPACGNRYASRAVISRLNPFNPFGFDLISTGSGANIVFFGRRPVEGGSRVFEQEVETRYLGTGFEGSFELAERA